MECDICARIPANGVGMHCPACARAMLLPGRITQVEVLLEKEKLRKEVEASLPRAQTESLSQPTTDPSTLSGHKLQFLRNQDDLQRTKERVEAIVSSSDTLKEKMEEYKREIETQKASAKQRWQEIEAAKAAAAENRPSGLERLKKTARRRSNRYDELYEDIVSSRTFLCKEAADLAGLQRHQRETPEKTILESYTLSGAPVIDLRDLNSTAPQLITASLTSISRLLLQACYYLEIRLPAEIKLPGENYPFPTIFSPASSFQPQNKDIPFPGLTSPASSSPAASRTIDAQDQAHISKPRPLYLHRKLSVLLREDPSQYNHFIEGVSLLSWCIAWLCRTQGLAVANADWEEICAIGRNMWLLLVEAPTAMEKRQQQRAAEEKQRRQARPRPSRQNTNTSDADSLIAAPNHAAKGTVGFARLSHGTAHSPLLLASSGANPWASAAPSSSTAATVDVSPRTWKFASPTGVCDSLKKHVLNEMAAQEWEVLSSGEFDGFVPAANDEPVVIDAPSGGGAAAQAGAGARRGSAAADGVNGAPHGAAAAAAAGAGGENAGDAAARDRSSGSSGWMKLKSRSSA